ADESVKIKRPESLVTKICVRGFREAGCRMALSGLPAPEEELELFSQFQFLNGEFLGYENFWNFKQNKFRPSWGHDWVPKPGALKQIRDELHSKAFVLTRKE